MSNAIWLTVAAYVLAASPAYADEFRFDFSGSVLSQTRPGPPSVTPQPITGSLQYTAPAGGDITTGSGDATLTTSLYGSFFFTRYSTTLSGTLFTFSGEESGQGFSLRASALPGGQFGFLNAGDGFALTGTPVNATGRLTGSFAGSPIAAAVPEPTSWFLMIAGFGLLGAVLRRRRSRVLSNAVNLRC